MIKWKVLIAHAKGEEGLAEKLAEPLRLAGYDVAHRGTVLVGDSVVEEASKALSTGGPVVLCGTVQAIGTKWARRIINAAKERQGVKVFALQMEEEADLDSLLLDGIAADYWRDPAKAVQDLIAALQKHYPPHNTSPDASFEFDAELKYRKLALESCDIIDLANLPESERHLATRRLELRRLYVPLRVRLELEGEAESTEATLESLERKRQQGRTALQDDDDDIKRYSIGERLAKTQRLVVLGDPGSGKSTIIRWLATAYLLRLTQDPDWKVLPDIATLPDQDWLPIIIRCRDLDSSTVGGSLDDMLWRTLAKTEFPEGDIRILRSLLREKLRQGRALLLIDGLDEIADASLRARFCRQLEQIHVAHPYAPIVVTSRIVGYREMRHRIGRGFEHVTIADLSREEKDDFAHRWSALTEHPTRQEVVARDLIKSIHSTDRIERLTGNPMLLTTLALVKRKVGKLPRRRVDLYSETVQVLLNWRAEVDEPIDGAEAIPQLEYIAYAMCERGKQQLRKDEVLELLYRMRQEYPQIHPVRNHTPEEFLPLLERRTGILLESGHVRHQGVMVPVFEFRHLTIQEYLAARALVDGRFPGRSRNQRLAENIAVLAKYEATSFESAESSSLAHEKGSWREVLRLTVASCTDDDAENILRAVLEPERDENAIVTSRPRAILSALCLADDPNVTEITATNILNRLVSLATFPNDLINNAGMSSAVKELSTSRWAPVLRHLLTRHFLQTSENREVLGHLYGVYAEATIPDNEEPHLRQWLSEKTSALQSTIETTVVEAALSLVQLQTWAVDLALVPIRELLNLLGTTPSATHAAVLALENLRITTWSQHGWVPRAQEAVAIITFLSSPVGQKDLSIASRLIRVLGYAYSIKTYVTLTAYLDHPQEEIRMAAVSALAEYGDPDAIPLLMKRLNDPVDYIRGAAAEALGQLGANQAVEPLLAMLTTETYSQQRSAIKALSQLRANQATPHIIKTSQANSLLMAAAVEALGNLQDPQCFQFLLDSLESSDPHSQRLAIEALGNLGDPRALQPIVAKFHEPDLAPHVVEALGQLGDVAAIPFLLQALQHPKSSVKLHAVASLLRLGARQAIHPLRDLLLEDRDPRVCFAAAEALGNLGISESTLPPLDRLFALTNRLDSVLRQKVGILIFGKLRDVRARPLLIGKLQSPDSYTRIAAGIALAELQDERAVDSLLLLLQDSDFRVRRIAAESLGKLKTPSTRQTLTRALSKADQAQPYILYALMLVADSTTDRELLSRRLNGTWPPMDLRDEIDTNFVRYAARKLNLQESIVRSHYESLALDLPLTLAWKPLHQSSSS